MTRKYEKEYNEYCDNLLNQLKEGGMNKLQIHLAKTMYKNNKYTYNDFVELYEESKDPKEETKYDIVFKPEGL